MYWPFDRANILLDLDELARDWKRRNQQMILSFFIITIIFFDK